MPKHTTEFRQHIPEKAAGTKWTVVMPKRPFIGVVDTQLRSASRGVRAQARRGAGA